MFGRKVHWMERSQTMRQHGHTGQRYFTVSYDRVMVGTPWEHDLCGKTALIRVEGPRRDGLHPAAQYDHGGKTVVHTKPYTG